MDLLEHIQGSLFGCAIGDALGWPVEFDKSIKGGSHVVTKLPEKPIFTDDTQMTIAVATGLMEHLDKTSSPCHAEGSAEYVAREFVGWLNHPDTPSRSPGSSCLHGCRELFRGTPWREAGKENSKGCGTAMRSAPYGWMFPGDPHNAAAVAAEHALMTHRHPEAQAAAAAVAAGVASFLHPLHNQPNWVAGIMAGIASQWDSGTQNLLIRAFTRDDGAEAVLAEWEGWTGAEAVAASLYCVLTYPDDFERAVLLAVNSPGDSDSLGAITGALVGARVGIKGIRKDWVSRIERSSELYELSTRFAQHVEAIHGGSKRPSTASNEPGTHRAGEGARSEEGRAPSQRPKISIPRSPPGNKSR
jgi:ADP-ribosylglycohydrolase